MGPGEEERGEERLAAEEAAAAAEEAGEIGGEVARDSDDPAQQPVIEGGEGESEGFELAERDLEDIASHGDQHRFPDNVPRRRRSRRAPSRARPTRPSRPTSKEKTDGPPDARDRHRPARRAGAGAGDPPPGRRRRGRAAGGGAGGRGQRLPPHPRRRRRAQARGRSEGWSRRSPTCGARGSRASGEVGDGDPIQAAQDALLREPADEVVIFEHEEEQARWFEAGLFERAKAGLDPPLRMVVLHGDSNGEHVVAVEEAGAGTVDPDADKEIGSAYLPGLSRGDLAGIVVAIVGTIAAAVLAAAVTAKASASTGAEAAAVLIAIGLALVNMAHVVGITLFEAVHYRGGFAKMFRTLSLVGTPAAVIANLVILLVELRSSPRTEFDSSERGVRDGEAQAGRVGAPRLGPGAGLHGDVGVLRQRRRGRGERGDRPRARPRRRLPRHRRHVRPVHQRGAGRRGDRRPPRRGRAGDQVRQRPRPRTASGSASAATPSTCARPARTRCAGSASSGSTSTTSTGSTPRCRSRRRSGRWPSSSPPARSPPRPLRGGAGDDPPRPRDPPDRRPADRVLALEPRPRGRDPATVRELGIGFVAYSPLGRGFLTGQIRSPEDLAEGDFRRRQPALPGRELPAQPRPGRQGRGDRGREGRAPPASWRWPGSWPRARTSCRSPAPSARSYLEQNVAAAAIELSAADLAPDRRVAPRGAAAGERYADMSSVDR